MHSSWEHLETVNASNEHKTSYSMEPSRDAKLDQNEAGITTSASLLCCDTGSADGVFGVDVVAIYVPTPFWLSVPLSLE